MRAVLRPPGKKFSASLLPHRLPSSRPAFIFSLHPALYPISPRPFRTFHTSHADPWATSLPVTMESVFSLDHFSTIAADLQYVLLLGQPLPEFPCTAWHISSQPAPSVPLVLGQRVLLVSPASRTYFSHLRSIFKIEKSSLVISVSHEPSAYGPFLPDTCHVHLPLSFVSLPWMH